MDYTTELFRVASKEFLFISAFRQKVRKGIRMNIEDVAADLEEIFRDQATQARTDPRLEAWYDKARYPLVVLADEILIHSGWEFSQEWEGRILEAKYFRTNIGGDQFFDLVRNIGADDTPLAAILFAGMALGFKGRYRERPERLVDIRKNLYRVLSEYISTVGDRLTPEAYNFQAGPPKRISPAVTLARVAIIGIGGLLLYYILTFAIWSSLVSDLKAAARNMGAL